MPMTAASMFWLDTLHDCNLDQSLPLPYDRYRLSNEHRIGRGTTICRFQFRSTSITNIILPMHHQTTYHLNILHLLVIMSSCLN